MEKETSDKLNTHTKGVKMQLLLAKEMCEYIESQGMKVLRVWNAPNMRPSKKPNFLKSDVLYANLDFLGSWDVAILARDGKELNEYLVQVKSRFMLKQFKEDQKLWQPRCNLHDYYYWAIYDMKLRRKEDILLKHFKVYDIVDIGD